MKGQSALVLRVTMAASVLALVVGGVAQAEDDGDQIQPIDFTHNAVDAPAPVTSATPPLSEKSGLMGWSSCGH